MHTDDDRSPGDGTSSDETATSMGIDDVAVSGFESPDTPFELSVEVPSPDMDDHDSDGTGELDLPDSLEDSTPHRAKADPGFDGWLDDDQVEASSEDPYTALKADEDDAAEIADWMAFTRGEDDAASAAASDADEPEVVVDMTDSAGASENTKMVASDEPSDAIPNEDLAADAAIEGFAADEPHEDTIELVFDESGDDQPDTEADDAPDEVTGDRVIAQPALEESEASEVIASPLVDDLASAGDPEEETSFGDPDALLIIPIVSIGTTISGGESDDPGGGGDASGDDTGEIPIVGVAAATAAAVGDQGVSSIYDHEEGDLTAEHFFHSATREHHELAAAVTAAQGMNTEQVAISAAIPGLESGVVGFDDVVAAEGDGSTALARPPKSSDLLLRVGTGAALVAAFLLSLLWRPAIIVLALAAFVIASGEFYSALIHRHYKPLSIVGFLGIVGAGLSAVVWGVIAIPIALALVITVLLLVDAVSQRRQGDVSGFTLTILVAAWIGGFGAFAFPIIASENYQALVLTVVAMVALVDIAAYGVGKSIGRRPFAPTISPKKTIEGFLGGTLMALLAGSAASFFVAAIDLPAGLMLGVVVAVFAPLGDLSVSVVKRSLDIKDMGSILPGHGGLLDRIDAIIAVIPAAWAALAWLGLL